MISINFQYFTVVYFQILCPYCSFFEVLRFYNFFIFHYCWLWDIYICIVPLMMTHKIISKQLEILIKLWSCKRDNFDKAFFEQIFRENIWRKLLSCKQAFIWDFCHLSNLFSIGNIFGPHWSKRKLGFNLLD